MQASLGASGLRVCRAPRSGGLGVDGVGGGQQRNPLLAHVPGKEPPSSLSCRVHCAFLTPFSSPEPLKKAPALLLLWGKLERGPVGKEFFSWGSAARAKPQLWDERVSGGMGDAGGPSLDLDGPMGRPGSARLPARHLFLPARPAGDERPRPRSALLLGPRTGEVPIHRFNLWAGTTVSLLYPIPFPPSSPSEECAPRPGA